MDRVKKLCKEDYKLNREESFNESAIVKRLNNLILDEQMGKIPTESQKISDVDWEDIFMISDLQKTSSWPAQTSNFKETIEEFQREIYKLAEKLLETISLNLGLEKTYIKEAFAGGEKPVFGTKVSHYPPCSRPDLIDGLRAHTDAGGLILLFQDDEVPGLQVLSEGQWIDVEPLPYSIVIDIGDQLEVVSAGKYKSAWHRILPTKDGNRLSVASFYNPSLNALVYPAASLALEEKTQPMVEENGGDHVSTFYPKFSFGDYMNVYSQQKYDAKEPRFEAMKALSEQAY